jgi:hypothetical protein|tara:strand:+ start:158 stop:385 length:228 start_codon:yes stop_codon:yes gene_type:complete
MLTLDIKQILAGVVTAGILSSLGFVFNNIDTLKTENAEQKAVINELVKDLEEAEDDIDTLRAMHNDILWQLGGNS